MPATLPTAMATCLKPLLGGGGGGGGHSFPEYRFEPEEPLEDEPLERDDELLTDVVAFTGGF